MARVLKFVPRAAKVKGETILLNPEPETDIQETVRLLKESFSEDELEEIRKDLNNDQ